MSWLIRRNVPPPGVYPDRDLDPDLFQANTSIPYLLGLPERRHRDILAYTGHFPFVVATLIDPELVTITLLRDPVERTISFLRQCAEQDELHLGRPLEEIYENTFYFQWSIHNHQTKIFAMTRDDPLNQYWDPIEIDDRRLETAKANLEQVDHLGLTEELPELLSELERCYGWDVANPGAVNVSEIDAEVSPSFRRRIAEDNAADMEFYRYACLLHERRRARRIPS